MEHFNKYLNKKLLKCESRRHLLLIRVGIVLINIICWASIVNGDGGSVRSSTSSLDSLHFSSVAANDSLVSRHGSELLTVTNSAVTVSALNGEIIDNIGIGLTPYMNSSSASRGLVDLMHESSSTQMMMTFAPSPALIPSVVDNHTNTDNQSTGSVDWNVTGSVGLSSGTTSSTNFNSSLSFPANGSSMPTSTPGMVTSMAVNYSTTTKIKVEEDKKFKYYSYKIINNDEVSFNMYWKKEDEIMVGKHHEVLEKQYLTAVTVKLNFTFLFYGHEVESVTVATGGFLYMSDFLHDRLTYSQYIAPLMANFGTELLNQSHIHYAGNSSSFTVWWENVTLKDYPSAGQFNFQATLFSTGYIAFAYDFLPIPISSISSQFHSVRVGLSDAYYFDEVTSAGYTERKISEYNRVAVSVTGIGNHSLVLIEPLPTCIQQKSCSACLIAASTLPFACQWCPQLKRCSDGFDRKRQQWLNYGCSTERVTALRGCSGNRMQLGFITVIIVVIATLLAAGLWLIYAHTHPNSGSGRWLIEHRPRACLGMVWKTSCCRSPSRRERYVSYQSGLESLA